MSFPLSTERCTPALPAQRQILKTFMEVLDHQSRELIDFRYGRGLTMEEIGKFYGVSKMAVSKRLRKLHQKLKGSVI